MPELPEVERARTLIAGTSLGRRIADVDDTDTFVCRPHAPGVIRGALLGRTLTAAHRRGKSMWCETSSTDGDPDPGPYLGIHLGMGGVMVFTHPDGTEQRDGDRAKGGSGGNPVWNRFTLRFEDGSSLVLFDKRRLGRVRLDPDIDALGPDAQDLTPATFRAALGTSTAPVKARMLDQSVMAGVGNLLADEALWRARVHPSRRSRELTTNEANRLQRNLSRSIDDAVENGGVHTGTVIAARHPGGECPRCGAPMERGTVGGRTTWWCSVEQTR
ncbi:formamidopyrimidine-DNA glycosylase [Nakamurella flavida]|uniref:Formamidopyrimidine-DNA glycosylase n=1 Tax=Nakamurella flavida TaxID=363630 RepID=A0A939C494_9ACTN|nr:DNA-formamidopyrimidine glycosylase family protein [Nakamurella flavida]MBM9474992.1 formamidopyrimidine-DNA glycosylase [Nakamurella flavida]MDP9776561.1 formamidopyrimidine-DNA glycosylase [Nakamurella flavida]